MANLKEQILQFLDSNGKLDEVSKTLVKFPCGRKITGYSIPDHITTINEHAKSKRCSKVADKVVVSAISWG